MFNNNKRFKKFRKSSVNGIEYRKTTLYLGKFGIKSLENTRLTTKQLDTFLFTLKKQIKKTGKIWQCVQPVRSVTSKPNEVRMGKGKGAIKCWVAPVKKGQILYEVLPLKFKSEKKIILALESVIDKLPVSAKIITSDIF